MAAPIRPLAGNPALAGTMAIRATRAVIRHGASNRFSPWAEDRWGGQDPRRNPRLADWDWPEEPPADPFGLSTIGREVSRWTKSLHATWAVDEAVGALDYDEAHAMTLSNTDTYRLDHVDEVGYPALINHGGNCGYLASACFAVLRAAGVRSIDMILILPNSGPRSFRNHTTCVIGIPDGVRNPKEPDYAAWRDKALLADVWVDNETVPAAKLAERWPKDTYRYLSYARAP
jgi:hypothetical protein